MATNQSGSSPSGLQRKIQNALIGAQQMPTGDSYKIDGQVVTQAQLVTQLAGYLPVFTAVVDAETARAQAVQARRAAEPVVRKFLVQLSGALLADYGRGSAALAKFGLSAKQPAALSTQTAILAVAKRTLTRQKRGTMGKKQKASIKAVGTPQVSVSASGVVVTPAAGEQLAVAPADSSSTPVTPGAAETPVAK